MLYTNNSPIFTYLYWPESSALGNAVDLYLATLPMALPPKNLFLKIA